MKSLKYLVVVSLLGSALLGCADGYVTKQGVGSVGGGVLGGILGSQVHGGGRTAAIIGGTVLGALVGGAIGKNMDDVDRMKMNQALESEPTNRTSSWENPDTHARYQVTPTRTYYEGTQACREYTTTAIIGGERKKVYGTACRTSDGNWKIVDSQ